MPLLETKGAASFQGFGQFSAVSYPLPTFIQEITDGSGSTQVYANTADNVAEDGAGSVYVGWIPNNITNGLLVASKLTSAGASSFDIKYAPTSYQVNNSWVSYSSFSDRVFVSGFASTGSGYASGVFVMDTAGGSVSGKYGSEQMDNSVVDQSSGSVYVAYYGYNSTTAASIIKFTPTLGISFAKNIYSGSSNQKALKLAGVDGSGNVWATSWDSGIGTDLIRMTSTGTVTTWDVSAITTYAGFYKSVITSTNVYLAGGTYLGILSLSNPTTSPVLVTFGGIAATCVAADSSGNFYVANTNSIAKFSSTYALLWAIKITPGTNITALALSADGKSLFVSCGSNGGSTSGYATVLKISTLGCAPGTYALTGGSSASVTVQSVVATASASSITVSATSRSVGSTSPTLSSSSTTGSTAGFTHAKYP